MDNKSLWIVFISGFYTCTYGADLNVTGIRGGKNTIKY